ncbi:MAG: hypothetical protein HGA38_01590 [Candidatus Moranbacteria bacterium]|nr:hypothetical protein [Candidatus Moranbacteria bacterium]
MPQIFYTTQDEEILSLVGRLRSSELLENVFVIPKRALVLQSIVNLRMLAREAEKSGKHVAIVTQDENGRRLAEKAGLETRPYSEEAAREPEPVVYAEEAEEDHPRVSVPAGSVGTPDFYGSQRPEMSTSPSSDTSASLRLRVRDTSPKFKTALNSMETPPDSTPVPQVPPVRPSIPSGPSDAGRLTRVFSSSPSREQSAPPSPRSATKRVPQAKSRKARSSVTVDTKGRALFVAFVALSVVFLVGTGAFILLPKAVVSVTPQSQSQDIEMDFEARTDPAAVGDRIVSARVVERDETVSVTVETTGSSAGAGSKASGHIVITNEYGSDPQQLVATTRFQTSDGKVFRLTKGVTVPGVSGSGKPGVAEAEVVADASGDSYNVGPTDFTIPGFAGGPKAGKIYAKSSAAMTGGSSAGSGGSAAVAAADMERARSEAEAKFLDSMKDSLSRDLATDERFVPDSIDIAQVGTPSVPSVGSVAASFEYKASFHGRVFVFSEASLREKTAALLRKNFSVPESFSTKDVTFRYEAGTSDFQNGSIRFKAGVSALFVAAVDVSGLRTDLLGKDADEIKPLLEQHPEVKNIEIELRPKGLSFAVPRDPKRVTVTVASP